MPLAQDACSKIEGRRGLRLSDSEGENCGPVFTLGFMVRCRVQISNSVVSVEHECFPGAKMRQAHSQSAIKRSFPVTFVFSIPTPSGAQQIAFEPGSSVIFVGANGSGKTRLAVHIENSLGQSAHRIAAHRALSLNAEVPKISEALALSGLRTGHASADSQLIHRDGNRWRNKNAVELLNDFDFLLQALFAEQSNTALRSHAKARAGDHSAPPMTKFEQLKKIWERLLPGRRLVVSGDNVQVEAGGTPFSASQMSDGERAAFYILGQALVAAVGSVLIVDEPELHMHPSIMSALWDEIEAARMDCGFVFITHDLEFAASRTAIKFVIRDYKLDPLWTLERVPQNAGFPEEIVTLILGSRRPILFVEGTGARIDAALYRACFPGWTVVPRGSCQDVIHSVATMRGNGVLTRVTCCGIVDADGREPAETTALAALGIAVLPVSEIENLMLLPEVSQEIAKSEGYSGEDLVKKLAELKAAVFKTLDNDKAVESVVARQCRRRIDRELKRLDLSGASTVAEIAMEYANGTAALDINAIAAAAKKKIVDAIEAEDLSDLLAVYDNKGLLALAASHLKSSRKDAFEDWLIRVLNNGSEVALVAGLRELLPALQAN